MNARSSRRLLLIGAGVCFGFYAIWLCAPLLGDAAPGFLRWGLMGTPAFFWEEADWAMFVNPPLFVGLMLLAQWAFLRPVRRSVLQGASAGRPRWPAFVAVALVCTLLCTGLVATILELAGVWAREPGATSGSPLWGERRSFVWLAMLGLWLVWSAVFFVYFRHGEVLGKFEVVVRALLRGSCLELLIAIPTHAWVYRRTTDDCYCVRGSYTGIFFGVSALLWAFGPGLVLLFLREQQRRAPILQQLCPQCGATLEVAGAPCPQCGRADMR